MKYSRIIISALVIIICTAGAVVAYAIINHSLTGSGNILASPNLGVFDSTCTNNLSSLSFPSQSSTSGSTASLTVCVKNTGNQAFYILATSSVPSVSYQGLPSGLSGNYSSSTTLPHQLQPGQTIILMLTLTDSGSAPVGPFSFTVNFVSYSSSTG